MTEEKYKEGFLKAEQDCRDYEARIQALQKENEILKEALGFYADQGNYNYSREYKIAEYWNDLTDDWDFGDKESPEYNENKIPLVFGGKRARQALKEITSEGE